MDGSYSWVLEMTEEEEEEVDNADEEDVELDRRCLG